MVSRVDMRFYILLCLPVLAAGYLGIQQNVDPTIIQEHLTKSLTVNCSVVEHANMSVINSNITNAIILKIYKTSMRSPSAYEPVAYVNGIVDKVESKFSQNATLKGHLTFDGKGSFISIRWDYPSFDKTGNYKCELTGLYLGAVVTVENVTQVSDAKPDLAAALQMIKSQDDRLTKLESSLKGTDEVLKRFKDTMFISTASENGTIYMLSRPFLKNTAMAESVCRLYDGYLVEFDAQEYILVKGILNNASLSEEVLVGIEDESLEGDWRSRKDPKNKATFTPWGAGQPGGGDTDDCAVLDPTDTWLLKNVACYDNSAYVHFLCEIHKSP